MKLTIEKNNFKKLTTMAGIALCATSLAFTNNVDTAKADTIDNARYTVQSGDTLWGIAQKYQVDLDQLEALNNKDANNTIIMPGEILVLPDHNNQSTQQVANVAATTQTSQAQTTVPTAPVAQTTNTTSATSNQANPTPAPSNNSAKEWIAQRESGGSYSARNGQYIGRYQLSSAYLNGDYSPANQERAANRYVNQRYGGWTNAKAFWQSHGWY